MDLKVHAIRIAFSWGQVGELRLPQPNLESFSEYYTRK
jgi:hypothetical protein